MKRKLRLRRLIPSLFLSLPLLLAPSAAMVAHGRGEIVLGVATTTGLTEGEESLQAVRLAVGEINRKGGIRVGARMQQARVVVADLRDAMPNVPVEQAISALDRLIVDHGVAAVLVGPFRSEVLLPAMDIIANHRVPMLGTIAMSPASEVKVIKDPRYRYVFRVGLNSRYLVAYLIDTMKFLRERFGFNRVFLMNQDVAWARTAASLLNRLYFDRAGWALLGMENYPTGCVDYSSGLGRAQQEGAQVILPIFDMPESGILVKQWNAIKVPALMAGFISPLAGPSAWTAFEKKIGGAIQCNFELGSAIASERVPKSVEFSRAYEEAFRKPMEAGHGPAPAYESVYILADAIERAGSLDSEKLVSALERTDRAGVMGRIRFHRGHQAVFGKDPQSEALACLFQWTETGRRRLVYPPSIAEGEITLPHTLAEPAKAALKK
ncbi:MAG: ABC transporter substrate-binding protein [Thermodesulfobacteriota bacterium]